MSLFACSNCNTVENSALGAFWLVDKPICSECEQGKWHGRFEKRKYTDANYQLCPDDTRGRRILCPKPNGWDYCKHGKEQSNEPLP